MKTSISSIPQIKYSLSNFDLKYMALTKHGSSLGNGNDVSNVWETGNLFSVDNMTEHMGPSTGLLFSKTKTPGIGLVITFTTDKTKAHPVVVKIWKNRCPWPFQVNSLKYVKYPFKVLHYRYMSNGFQNVTLTYRTLGSVMTKALRKQL